MVTGWSRFGIGFLLFIFLVSLVAIQDAEARRKRGGKMRPGRGGQQIKAKKNRRRARRPRRGRGARVVRIIRRGDDGDFGNRVIDVRNDIADPFLNRSVVENPTIDELSSATGDGTRPNVEQISSRLFKVRDPNTGRVRYVALHPRLGLNGEQVADPTVVVQNGDDLLINATGGPTGFTSNGRRVDSEALQQIQAFNDGRTQVVFSRSGRRFVQ